MTALQVLSMPFWFSGAILAVVSTKILLGHARKKSETTEDLVTQFLFGVALALIFWTVATWMWQS